jgi:hypothetical protein
MTEFIPSEKGQTIRFPSTANLYIDSQDRTQGLKSNNFTISKPNNILAGFFTRLAVQEVVVDYCVNNISTAFNNNFLTAYLFPVVGNLTTYTTSGSVATLPLTITAPSPPRYVGQVVQVAGATPSGLNAIAVITSTNSSQFTYANTTAAGSGATAGTATILVGNQPIRNLTGNGTTIQIVVDTIPAAFIVGAKVDIASTDNNAFNNNPSVSSYTIASISGTTISITSNIKGTSTGGQIISIGQVGTATLGDGEYLVSEAITVLVAQLNSSSTGGASLSGFTIVQGSNITGQTFITGTYPWQVIYDQLAINLDLQNGFNSTLGKLVECPKLLPTLYFDIICNNLTYCQDLKDASTSSVVRDVLYRWYLAWDGPTTYDPFGYPIFQGYKPFLQRRSIPFPKQIKWDNNLPIGQLQFQVYDDKGNLFQVGGSVATSVSDAGSELEFNLNLLISEQ